MQLDETARSRLEDIHDLEPTSNRELRERWGMDSGKEVATYLREELGSRVYRDDEKRIRARNGAGIEDGAGGSADGSQDAVDDAAGDGDGQPQQDPSDPADAPDSPTTTASPDALDDSGPPATSATDPTGKTPPHDPDVVSVGDADSGGADASSSTDASPDPALEEAEQGCSECGGELVDTRRTSTLQVEGGGSEPAPDNFYCTRCGKGHNHNEDERPQADADTDDRATTSVARGAAVLAVVGGGLVAAFAALSRREQQPDGPRTFGRD